MTTVGELLRLLYYKGVKQNMYAKIIINGKHTQIDRCFDYGVPIALQSNICVGVRVMIPFGARNAKTEGYVLSLTDQTDVPQNKLKYITEILDDGKPIFTDTLLTLAQWMKETYFCTLNQCLQVIMPSGIATKSTWYVTCIQQHPQNLTPNEQSLFDCLQQQGGSILLQELEQTWGKKADHTLHHLKEKKVVQLYQKTTRSTYEKKVKQFSLTTDTQQIANIRQQAKTNKKLYAQCRILTILEQEKSLTAEAIKQKAGVTDSPIKTLCKNGILIESIETIKRDVFSITDFEKTTPFIPTSEQQKALQTLYEQLSKPEKKPVLLHGVTGSGKTEIYMQLIQKVIEQGKQAIVLVPEISLTPQMTQRFVSRFGNQVSVIHSRLSTGERIDQWRKARDGEVSVMIGARSALFVPFSNIGAIIMDESHENSYISDTTPKYRTIEVAKKIASLTGALFVMGSATPDLESYYHAQNGDYTLMTLKNRTTGSRLPQTHIVDLRQELEQGNRSMFSRVLQQSIEQTLQRGEQIMLFLNRRGYATFVSCRSCGNALCCPDCNITYTYHAHTHTLMCHYCGKEIAIPQTCPDCGSKYIRYFGTGTEKVEQETKKLFPDARILRMDLDTTMKKGSHERILGKFGRGEADILIGTQMIAKGHDFPNVTLVGILAADTSLYTGGYQSAETCFQLLTQASGRAGRAHLSGEVYIQTYQPEHHAIRFAASQDYMGFYQQELTLRKIMEYPPFVHIFSVLVTGEQEQSVKIAIEQLAQIMAHYNQKTKFTIIGPSPAMLSKFRGEYRYQIFVKSAQAQRLKAFVLYCVEKLKSTQKHNVYFHLSFDPQNIV